MADSGSMTDLLVRLRLDITDWQKTFQQITGQLKSLQAQQATGASSLTDASAGAASKLKQALGDLGTAAVGHLKKSMEELRGQGRQMADDSVRSAKQKASAEEKVGTAVRATNEELKQQTKLHSESAQATEKQAKAEERAAKAAGEHASALHRLRESTLGAFREGATSGSGGGLMRMFLGGGAAGAGFGLLAGAFSKLGEMIPRGLSMLFHPTETAASFGIDKERSREAAQEVEQRVVLNAALARTGTDMDSFLLSLKSAGRGMVDTTQLITTATLALRSTTGLSPEYIKSAIGATVKLALLNKGPQGIQEALAALQSSMEIPRPMMLARSLGLPMQALRIPGMSSGYSGGMAEATKNIKAELDMISKIAASMPEPMKTFSGAMLAWETSVHDMRIEIARAIETSPALISLMDSMATSVGKFGNYLESHSQQVDNAINLFIQGIDEIGIALTDVAKVIFQLMDQLMPRSKGKAIAEGVGGIAGGVVGHYLGSTKIGAALGIAAGGYSYDAGKASGGAIDLRLQAIKQASAAQQKYLSALPPMQMGATPEDTVAQLQATQDASKKVYDATYAEYMSTHKVASGPTALGLGVSLAEKLHGGFVSSLASEKKGYGKSPLAPMPNQPDPQAEIAMAKALEKEQKQLDANTLQARTDADQQAQEQQKILLAKGLVDYQSYTNEIKKLDYDAYQAKVINARATSAETQKQLDVQIAQNTNPDLLPSLEMAKKTEDARLVGQLAHLKITYQNQVTEADQGNSQKQLQIAQQHLDAETKMQAQAADAQKTLTDLRFRYGQISAKQYYDSQIANIQGNIKAETNHYDSLMKLDDKYGTSQQTRDQQTAEHQEKMNELDAKLKRAQFQTPFEMQQANLQTMQSHYSLLKAQAGLAKSLLPSGTPQFEAQALQTHYQELERQTLEQMINAQQENLRAFKEGTPEYEKSNLQLAQMRNELAKTTNALRESRAVSTTGGIMAGLVGTVASSIGDLYPKSSKAASQLSSFIQGTSTFNQTVGKGNADMFGGIIGGLKMFAGLGPKPLSSDFSTLPSAQQQKQLSANNMQLPFNWMWMTAGQKTDWANNANAGTNPQGQNTGFAKATLQFQQSVNTFSQTGQIIASFMQGKMGPFSGALSGATAGGGLGQMMGQGLNKVFGMAASAAGPIGAAIGSVAGLIAGIFTSAAQDMATKISDDFSEMMNKYHAGSQDLITTLNDAKAAEATAIAQLSHMKGGQQELDALIPQFNQTISQLEDQQRQVFESFGQAEITSGLPIALQSTASQVQQLVQQWYQYIAAGGDVNDANKFLSESFDNLKQNTDVQIAQDYATAVQDALTLNQLLIQRQQLENKTTEDINSVMNQGVLVRQQTLAQTKAIQIANIQFQADQQKQQMDQQINLEQYKVAQESKLFNLASTRIGLEQQLLSAQSVGVDNDMRRIAALQQLVAGIQSMNGSFAMTPALVNALQILQYLNLYPFFQNGQVGNFPVFGGVLNPGGITPTGGGITPDNAAVAQAVQAAMNAYSAYQGQQGSYRNTAFA
ncbi:MAG: hypothetical protein KGL39_13630 [Patescibacteria group bacterium]|nr:hypothetical protein [Patescibacteria group bacterium]